MNEPIDNSASRFETLVAVMVSIVSVVGAIVAWRASISASGAGDGDSAGLRATINVVETRALSAVNVYSDMASFVAFYKDRELLKSLEAEFEDLDEEEKTEEELLYYASALADLQDAITLNQFTFPNQYLQRDGTYNRERQFAERFSDALREKDLSPQVRYDEADSFRLKTDNLLLALVVLVVALVFYTLIEVSPHRLRYGLFMLGTLLFVAGSVWALWIEAGGI